MDLMHTAHVPAGEGPFPTIIMLHGWGSNAHDLLGIAPSRSTIARILNGHSLQPHRSRYFLHISDPDFFPKMEQLIALYKSKPKHLFCFDECPGIQVLQRLAPGLHPEMSPEDKRKWLEEFEYIRHGTLDVLAFLHVETGTVRVQCRADHTKETFLSVFRSHALAALNTAGDEAVHYILDNLASHFSYEFCELIASLSGVACPPRNLLKSGAERRQLDGPDPGHDRSLWIFGVIGVAGQE